MSYLALYRKYRPDNFNDIVGQSYIIKTLKNEIVNKKVSHAYLFYGPRGTGKTTMAKTFAKLVNCKNVTDSKPCEKCDSCLLFNDKSNPDIIEIDAASNNGVEEIRSIRDNVSLMPSVSNYKVYIIDEVHMLSSGAFNALLKTLEEPPKHVIFILATTEFYKVPETIVSRCQIFEFERLSDNVIYERLKYIANKENIIIDDPTLLLIAKYSNGGLRDSIGMLDKLASASDNITCNDFYELRGIASDFEINELIKNIYYSSSKDVFSYIESINKEGKSLILVIEKLIEYFKNCIINNCDELNSNADIQLYYDAIDELLKTELNTKNLENPNIVIQVGILKLINIFNKQDKIISREIILEKKCIENTKNRTKDIEFEKKVVKNNSEYKKVVVNNALATADKSKKENALDKWVKFSNYLNSDDYSGVVSYLIDAELCVMGTNDVIISVKYDSILLNVNKSFDKINELFNLVMEGKYNMAFITDDEWNKVKKQYVNDKRNGVVYNIIDYKENITCNQIINNDDISCIVNDAISLVGNDMVEIK